MNRGYFGIGVLNIKSEINYGTLYRSAFNFGADFIFLIGKRFHKQASDTVSAFRHIPLLQYTTSEDFVEHLPYDCYLISIEINKRSKDIREFYHPERAIYLLGPEDGNISDYLLNHSQAVLQIPTNQCLNVAVAGSIVMYDRLIKRGIDGHISTGFVS